MSNIVTCNTIGRKPVAIYVVLDDAESPRYVGMSTRPHVRALEHARRRLWFHGLRIIEWVPVGVRWQEREKYWVRYYGRFCKLENLTQGGGATIVKSDESKQRFRAKMLGRKHSPETRANLLLASHRRTPEQRAAINAKISQAKKGRSPRLSESERLRRSLHFKAQGLHRGRPHSIETKKKIGEKSKGRPPNSGSFNRGKKPLARTPEWIEKIRIANTGKRHSEETKQKIREKRALQEVRCRET